MISYLWFIPLLIFKVRKRKKKIKKNRKKIWNFQLQQRDNLYEYQSKRKRIEVVNTALTKSNHNLFNPHSLTSRTCHSPPHNLLLSPARHFTIPSSPPLLPFLPSHSLTLSLSLWWTLSYRTVTQPCRWGTFSVPANSPDPSRKSDQSTPPTRTSTAAAPPRRPMRGPPCCRSFSGKSFAASTPPRTSGRTAKTSSLAPASASAGETWLARSFGLLLTTAKSLSLLALNRCCFSKSI